MSWAFELGCCKLKEFMSTDELADRFLFFVLKV